jgi:hypothetical protein
MSLGNSSGLGLVHFFSPHCQEHNRARLAHLAHPDRSLGYIGEALRKISIRLRSTPETGG